MGAERTMLIGRQADLIRKRKTLRIEAQVHVTAMRQRLDIYSDPETLSADEILESAKRFHAIAIEIRGMNETLAKIESELG